MSFYYNMRFEFIIAVKVKPIRRVYLDIERAASIAWNLRLNSANEITPACEEGKGKARGHAGRRKRRGGKIRAEKGARRRGQRDEKEEEIGTRRGIERRRDERSGDEWKEEEEIRR